MSAAPPRVGSCLIIIDSRSEQVKESHTGGGSDSVHRVFQAVAGYTDWCDGHFLSVAITAFLFFVQQQENRLFSAWNFR
jgi:hypothetical protein